MLNAANADLIAATAAPRPNGADQAHGLRLLGRPSHIRRERPKPSDVPLPTRIAPEDDLPWQTLRPLFVAVIACAAAVGFIACRCSLPTSLFGF